MILLLKQTHPALSTYISVCSRHPDMEEFTNEMIQTIKKQGLKVALPLLLLTTACGDEIPSASQFDALNSSSDQGTEEVIEADTNAFAGLRASLNAEAEAQAASNEFDGGIDLAKVVLADESATKVPEPTALAGLAIAALGLGAIKRKQSV